jgi:lipopolysaccharide export system ATP-binding protein
MSLIAENLVKSYSRRRVVDGVSVQVDRGEIVGLLGPNGAGKTTSFYMIIGAVHSEAGRVMLDGQDLAGQPMHVRCRKGIGYLAQQPSVFRKLTVLQNLLLVLEMQSLPRRAQREKADELLTKLGISHLSDRTGMVLSGGERRRVEIARTLCTEPSFILLDEPFTGVDPIAIEEIQSIITDLRSDDIGILITDHNVRETLGITDRAYIIFDGQIRVEGTSDQIVDDPAARKYYLGEKFQM